MKVRADEILYALSRRNKKTLWFTEVKLGPTWDPSEITRRVDAISIWPSWTNPCISIYEVKVSRSDFTRDKKHLGYLGHCHRMYFACPSGMIQPHEIHSDIGLVWYNPESGGLKTVKKAEHRELEGLPAGLLYYLVLSRMDHERHPFFSSRRQMLEALVEDKYTRWELGRRVNGKLAAVTEERDALRRELAYRKKYREIPPYNPNPRED